VLDGAAQLCRGHALFLGDQLVEQQQDGSRGVDGHRGGHLAEGDPLEEATHVVERVDGHTDLPDLSGGEWGVGVEPHLGGQVEGDREPGLTGLEEVEETAVGLGCCAKPGVLAHRPETGPVHPRMDPAGVGHLSGLADTIGDSCTAIDRVDLDPARGASYFRAFLVSWHCPGMVGGNSAPAPHVTYSRWPEKRSFTRSRRGNAGDAGSAPSHPSSPSPFSCRVGWPCSCTWGPTRRTGASSRSKMAGCRARRQCPSSSPTPAPSAASTPARVNGWPTTTTDAIRSRSHTSRSPRSWSTPS